VAEETSNPIAIFAAWRDFQITFFCDVAREFFFREADPRARGGHHMSAAEYFQIMPFWRKGAGLSRGIAEPGKLEAAHAGRWEKDLQ
jgi:hypothetical protein